ncbi:MAG: hypothetical protein K2N28_01240 [Muribaculaceae bacterium]|nr:hypothetical protein [Muribaculaceae bacterium]
MSNKCKRNLWLVLGIMSVAIVIDRAIRLAHGDLEWWQMLSPIIITVFFTRFYLAYRRAVREGNMYGKVCPLKKPWFNR